MKLTENIMFVSLGFSLPKQSTKIEAQSDVEQERVKASAKLYSGKAFQAITTDQAKIRNKG